MALTTLDQQRIAENVVSDQNANLSLPFDKPRTVSSDAAILFNKSIVARPLMVPEVCSLNIKNTEYRYRWVNAQGGHGLLYRQRLSQGFTNATTDDAEVLAGDAVADKGEIRAGDVILMKIRADLYESAIKYNMQKAQTLSRTRGMYLEDASADVMSDKTATRHSIAQEGFNKNSAPSFIPENPDKIVNDSIASGRVNDTRKVMDELRNKEN